MSSERIVVTGMGIVSPLGSSPAAYHQALAAGSDGISALNKGWDTGYRVNRAGLIPDFDVADFISDPIYHRYGRTTQLALAASQMALADGGLLDGARNGRTGVVVGTAMGEALARERHWQSQQKLKQSTCQSENSTAAYPSHHIHKAIAACFALDGPSHLLTTTCASGNHAISWASELLQAGAADAIVAVGADTLSYVDILGVARLLLQAPDCCRPFDRHRKGLVFSEGAGALLLEPLARAQRRGATILAEVAGCGLSCDAAGAFSGKANEVDSLLAAAQEALRAATCKPDNIQYISAHGSGTKLNDARETVFIKQLLGKRAENVPVSAIKSMVGHGQGAAGLFAAIAAILSLQYDVLYPTINYETPDPQCDLDVVPNQARAARVDTIMSNAFGIGGNNAVIILERWQA